MSATEGGEAIAAQMSSAACDLIDALDEAQRNALRFRLDDEAIRRDWGYFPRAFHGLALGAMSAAQQKRAHRLVAAGLSLHAYAKVTTIVALDNVLDAIEGRGRAAERDPGRYFLTVFGEPRSGTWAWQFEGHHVSLNFTIAGGRTVSPTPIFLGSNPAEVRHGARIVLRVVGEEEDAARELLAALEPERRTRAVICAVAPPDFVLMNLPRVPERILPGEAGGTRNSQARFARLTAHHRQALRFARAEPLGLAAAAMTPLQRGHLEALVSVYLDRLPPELARIERAKLVARGLEHLRFAWAGEEQRGRGHYYRLQGPSLVIEYDNTQDGANHVHAVWRDADDDFGETLLRDHYAHGH